MADTTDADAPDTCRAPVAPARDLRVVLGLALAGDIVLASLLFTADAAQPEVRGLPHGSDRAVPEDLPFTFTVTPRSVTR